MYVEVPATVRLHRRDRSEGAAHFSSNINGTISLVFEAKFTMKQSLETSNLPRYTNSDVSLPLQCSTQSFSHETVHIELAVKLAVRLAERLAVKLAVHVAAGCAAG